jgi:outer membrane immunogenic protein
VSAAEKAKTPQLDGTNPMGFICSNSRITLKTCVLYFCTSRNDENKIAFIRGRSDFPQGAKVNKTFATLVTLAASLPVTAALAADMPMKAAAPPVPYASAYNWTGVYIGSELGWGWANQTTTVVTSTAGSAFPVGSISSNEVNGLLGGFDAGYNYQFNQNFLVGIDGSFTFSGLDGTSRDVSTVNGNVDNKSDRMRWLSTATGRIGYVTDNWLWYAKGGWAWAEFDADSAENTPAGVVAVKASSSEDRDGWTAGGGVEWGFAAHWSAKLEYDYVKFGTANFTNTANIITGPLAGTTAHFSRSTTSDLNLIKGGVAFRF